MELVDDKWWHMFHKYTSFPGWYWKCCRRGTPMKAISFNLTVTSLSQQHADFSTYSLIGSIQEAGQVIYSLYMKSNFAQ